MDALRLKTKCDLKTTTLLESVVHTAHLHHEPVHNVLTRASRDFICVLKNQKQHRPPLQQTVIIPLSELELGCMHHEPTVLCNDVQQDLRLRPLIISPPLPRLRYLVNI